jgi:hypothetical protein
MYGDLQGITARNLQEVAGLETPLFDAGTSDADEGI